VWSYTEEEPEDQVHDYLRGDPGRALCDTSPLHVLYVQFKWDSRTCQCQWIPVEGEQLERALLCCCYSTGLGDP
jgi:hypothetical protein